ncbi:MAG TPA: hypothetical protein VN376_10690 [Longilinea sp.]|nr:hypothetical protein [Longilinea sp.]
MADEQVKFIPFHAINDMMLAEYRLQVLQWVFSKLDELPTDKKNAIQASVRRFAQVQGFRNAAMAPAPLRAKGSVKAFEQHPGFVSQILSAWAALQPQFAQRVYTLLEKRGWKLLPIETEREKLPGFLTRWRKSEDFDVIHAAYREDNPEETNSDDDISLMVIWLSGRLPVDLVDTEESE